MYFQSLRYSYIGLFFGVAVVLGFVVGGALDKRFHTGSWCTMIGVLLGIASGFKELYRLARNYQKELTKSAADEAAQQTAQDSRDARSQSSRAPNNDTTPSAPNP
jgi:F0F1-type ATP synthase assembly protein I